MIMLNNYYLAAIKNMLPNLATTAKQLQCCYAKGHSLQCFQVKHVLLTESFHAILANQISITSDKNLKFDLTINVNIVSDFHT